MLMRNIFTKTKESDVFESCVVCNGKTPVRRDTPVDKRALYVKGIGQVCYDCWHQVFSNAEGNIIVFSG